MAVAQRQASPTPSPQHLQCDSQALIALAVQITMAVAHKHTLPTSVPQPLQYASEPVRTLAVEITMAVAHRDMLQTSVPQPLQCDSEPVRTLAAQITMAVAHNHNGSPFWRLWILRLPRGSQRHQRRQRAPQPILRLPRGRQPAAPAATTRATAPSAGSGYCACHEDSQRHQRRQRAPQPLLEALGTAPATRTASASGDNARRSPFCHEEDSKRHNARRNPERRDRLLKTVRRPLRTDPAQRLLQSPETAPATAARAGPPAATTRATGPSAVSIRRLRRPLRREPGPQRRPPPAATTRAAAPSGGSGYCACHEDCQRHQRRQRAPQPLLEALGTAPATRKTASGTSGGNARRSPFCEALGTAPATRTASASGDYARRSPF